MKNVLGWNTHTYNFPSAQNDEDKLYGSTEPMFVKLVQSFQGCGLHPCWLTKAQELLDILLLLMSCKSWLATSISGGNSFFAH